MLFRDFVMLRRRKKKGPLTLLCGASVDTDLVPVDNSVVRYVWYSVLLSWMLILFLYRKLNLERKKGFHWKLYYWWEQEGSICYFCKFLWFQTGSNIIELWKLLNAMSYCHEVLFNERLISSHSKLWWSVPMDISSKSCKSIISVHDFLRLTSFNLQN